MLNTAEIIAHLRDGETLATKDIQHIAQGIADHSVSDAQLGSFAMAVMWRGLSTPNIITLTETMRDSGQVLKWDVDGPCVDKHSTGGVGDCVSLALAPILAAMGLYVPMISGRGLGHTGGTLDKLGSIPGFQTQINLDQMQKNLRETGCFIVGQSGDLAPADQRFYAIRDITGTVPSPALIVGSILSKKLAAGLDHLVLDVKTGQGAFMKSPQDAEHLGHLLVQCANQMGCPSGALITAMDIPLAQSAGNALEVREILSLLRGECMESRLYDITRALCHELLHSTGLKTNKAQIDDCVTSGRAMEVFQAMCVAQGAKGDFETHLPIAKLIVDFNAPADMEFHGFDAYALGMAVVDLGGGRRQADDIFDPAVGIDRIMTPSRVHKGDRLARIHASSRSGLEAAQSRLGAGMRTNTSQLPLVLERIT